MKNRPSILAALALLPTLALLRTAGAAPAPDAWVLADTKLLLEAGIEIRDSDPETGVSLARIDSIQETKLGVLAHEHGKCGGFERVPVQPWMGREDSLREARTALLRLSSSHRRLMSMPSEAFTPVVFKERIANALAQASDSELARTVGWLSDFETRYHATSTPNFHVDEMSRKIAATLKGSRWAWTGELIAHQGTRQKSIRIRIPGRTRPAEIVVLGGHLDSINYTFFSRKAPGADDNASGSANLLEALRVLAYQDQPERTVEFYWYAAEEAGLIGSSEIAAQHARDKKNVVAALQLDMTLFPGDGEFTLGSMTDFTSPALRAWFGELNKTYIGARIIEDKCGYACSDHASWHSHGYPALMPFEASFDRMFTDLHTPRDVVSDKMSFRHSGMFTRIAIAFAMELGGF